MIYNLQNIIPLGVLDYEVYPAKDRRPIIYLYYRPNGDLMMYRTKDEIEVNLTNSSSYDTNILFKVSSKDSIFDNDITCFESRPIDVDKATYNFEYVKDSSGYIYILVPAIYNTHSIFINNDDATDLFSFEGVYEHIIENIRDKEYRYYYVYRTTNKRDITDDLTVTLLINRITEDEVSLIVKHIADYNDPHHTIEKILSMNIFSAIKWQESLSKPSVINLDIIRSTTEEIDSIPIKDKQFLFDTDKKIFYVDSSTERVAYGNYKEIDLRHFIRSSQIQRIEFVDSGYVPQEKDFVLYLEISGYPTITVDIHNISVPAAGGKFTVNISSNTQWTVNEATYNTDTGNYELYWAAKKSTILLKPLKTPELIGSTYYIDGNDQINIIFDENDTSNEYSNLISFITKDNGVKANVDIIQESQSSGLYLRVNKTNVDISKVDVDVNVTSNVDFEILNSTKDNSIYTIPWGDSTNDKIIITPNKSTLEGNLILNINSSGVLVDEYAQRSKLISLHSLTGNITTNITVIQNKNTTIFFRANPKSLTYEYSGGTKSVHVDCDNARWSIYKDNIRQADFTEPDTFTIKQANTNNNIAIKSSNHPTGKAPLMWIDGDSDLEITLLENTSNEDITTEIYLNTNTSLVIEEIVTVIQKKKSEIPIEDNITITPKDIILYYNGGTATATVESNKDWTIE